LLIPTRGKLLLDRAPNLRKPLLDTVCDLLPQVPLSLCQASGHVRSADTDLLAKGGIEPLELLRNFCFYIHLRGSRNPAQQYSREPKQDKDSGENSNQQYGPHSKWLI
jgi:hypothetical protein